MCFCHFDYFLCIKQHESSKYHQTTIGDNCLQPSTNSTSCWEEQCTWINKIIKNIICMIQLVLYCKPKLANWLISFIKHGVFYEKTMFYQLMQQIFPPSQEQGVHPRIKTCHLEHMLLLRREMQQHQQCRQLLAQQEDHPTTLMELSQDQRHCCDLGKIEQQNTNLNK